jgi:hypothetical protein
VDVPKLPGYYQALYVLMQSLVDPDTAWTRAVALKGFNFTAFPLTKTAMLYYVGAHWRRAFSAAHCASCVTSYKGMH